MAAQSRRAAARDLPNAPRKNLKRPGLTGQDSTGRGRAGGLMQTCVPVSGMTCAACEVRIGKLLRGLPGVTDVTVSRRRGEAIVTSNRPLDMAMAASRLDKAGYSLAREKRAWISHNPSVWWDLAAGVVLVGLIAVAWRQLGAERLGNVVGPGGIGANLALVVVLGVAASLSTCMALVGGIVVGLSARFAETHPQATTVQRLRPQVMFNLGRIVGFTVLGAMIGLVGGLVTIQGAYLGVTMIIVGVVMGLLAIKLTDISPRLAAFSFTLPVFGAGRREGGGGLGRGFYRDGNALVLGVLSFFLPCGFTQAVQVYALSTGQAGRAALVMGLFALGTTPGLMGIGSLGALVRGAHAQRLFHLLGVAVAAFAVINLVSGVSMIWGGGGGGISLEASRTDNVTEAGGGQLARISVGGQGYSPQTTVVYAGQPVRVEFIADGFGCASVVNAKGLGHPDRIVVETSASLEFTPDQPGTYGYQCAMGMYRGSIIAISPPAPPDGPDQQKGTE